MDYNTLASKESINKTVAALNANGVEAFVVETGAEALNKIEELIPKGASVINGASRTLEQIGFIEYLKSGQHEWNNLHEVIVAEKDRAKQMLLRKQATLSDYYLGSVNALTEDGQLVIGSNIGNQLPSIVFSSSNLIFVASTKKIVPKLADAMQRIEEHVIALEDENIMGKYNMHTMLSKVVIFKKENPLMGRKVRMILVNEDLGF